MRALWLVLLAVPGAAQAHASERAVLLTLPTGWYLIGAALVVALTAALALLAGKLPASSSNCPTGRRITSWAEAGKEISLEESPNLYKQ